MKKEKAISYNKIKMNLLRTVLILFFIVLVCNLLIFYSLKRHISSNNFNNNAKETKVPIYLDVMKPSHIGVNRNTDALYFGGGPPGSILRASFNLTNYNENPLFINFEVDGRIKDWITLSINNFTLKPNETEKVNIIALIPEEVSMGKYNSTLIIKERVI
ncbi:MAG: hypothetical protein GWP09_00885 [Nitrospiraceae bacterium]|nr:hypothetical protein [Nitrospiraceae bacterium]